MASTAPLRRSKRKQISIETANQDDKSPPQVLVDDSPALRKRARKAATPIIHHPADSPPTPPPTSTPHLQQPLAVSPFLALPRELRDQVYKHILLSSPSTTTLKSGSHRTSTSSIATRCGLVGANAQLCEEFLDAVLFHAPVIATTVRNHNFAHVVTFLNRLSDAQRARLSSSSPTQPQPQTQTQTHGKDDDGVASKRTIRILLTYSAGARDSRAHLNRWLDRFDAPEKRGREFCFEYEGDESYRNGGYKQRPRNRATASKRWNEEAKKIAEATVKRRRCFTLYGMEW